MFGTKNVKERELIDIFLLKTQGLQLDGRLDIPVLDQPIKVKGQDLMSRTFYVDQVNGNDTTGDGTYAAPFKTLQKAIDSVPVGGNVAIYLLSDYTLQTGEEVNVYNNKLVYITSACNLTTPADFKTLTSNGGHIWIGRSIVIIDKVHLNVQGTDSMFAIPDAGNIGTLLIGYSYNSQGNINVNLSAPLINVGHSIAIVNIKFANLNSNTGTAIPFISKSFSGQVLFKSNNLIIQTDTANNPLITVPAEGLSIL